MSGHARRILQWICTGDHIFETDYAENKAVGTAIGTEDVQSGSVRKATSGPSEHTVETSTDNSPDSVTEESPASRPEPIELLIGCDGDPLIPSTEEINSTYLQCQSLWRTYAADANLLPPGCVPAASFETYDLMHDVPALPQDLYKKQIITGRALWYVPSPEFHMTSRSSHHNDEDCWNPERIYGATKSFPLLIDEPTRCGISSRSDFYHCTSNKLPSDHDPNGLIILTLMWQYILSVRLLEMQRRSIQYSPMTLSPILADDVRPQSSEVVIHLGDASRKLVRWVCALLVQGPGWLVKGRLPPWTTYYYGYQRFSVITTRQLKELEKEEAPSSSVAAALLIEFCQLYPFGSQPTAAFFAALVLPFHNKRGFHPQLPMPRIHGPQGRHSQPLDRIQDYVNDLPYYMTLSICPRYLGSAVWSIFWEPGVPCNLASAWLGSIHQVIKPLLEVGSMEMLAKVFALRRPQLAPLWLGIFVCGCTEILDMIGSYLTTLEEQPYFGSWARPDPDVAVWTGSHQSFFDETCSGPYIGQNALVPRADLLRHRFNFRLGDVADIVHFGWQPCGVLRKTDIEPELWPRLECEPQPRIYIHWIWWLSKDKRLIEKGFRHNMLIPTKNSKRELHSTDYRAKVPPGFNCEVRLEPSKEATFRVFDWGSKAATGDRSIDAMAIPGIRKHPWFVDAREIA
jgi:hypothetical protein